MTDVETGTQTDPTTDKTDQPMSTADIASEPERRAESATSDLPASEDLATDGNSRTHGSDLPEPKTAPLFSADAAADLRDRWTDVQAGFVDEPRSAVERADTLVAEVMKRLAESFATEREALERQWSKGDDASTEDLRIALRRYRSFFDRLLSI